MRSEKISWGVSGDAAYLSLPYHGENYLVTVDAADLELVLAPGSVRLKNGCWQNRLKLYAASQSTFLHRLLLDAPTGMMVDHVNHDTLDNRRSNLRIVTNAVNMLNRAGWRGYLQPAGDKLKARVNIAGKQYYLGHHETQEQAQSAIDTFVAVNAQRLVSAAIEAQQ